MNSLSNITITTAVLASLVVTGSAVAGVEHYSPAHGAWSPVRASASAVPAASLGGVSGQKQPIIATVSKNRRTIAVTAAYVAECATERPSLSNTRFAPMRIKKNGRYAAKRQYGMKFPDGFTLIERYTVSGKVTKRGTSTGTFKIEDFWINPDGVQDDVCVTGTQRYSLADARTLAGTTNKGYPVVLKHSGARDWVSMLLIPWTADCSSGDWIWGTADATGPIAGSGAFAATATPTTDLGGGQSARATQTAEATLGAHGATGTWKLTASISDATGSEVDSCDTGVLSFKLT